MRKLIFWLILTTTAAYGQISGAGQLGCSPNPVTGSAWSSATGSNATQTLLSGVSAAAALVQLTQTTTITGGGGTLELSYDATNWITVPVAQVINPSTAAQLTNPYTFQASTNKVFYIPLNGATNLRIRLSTVITGTGTVTPVTTALCSFSEPQTVTDASGNLLVNLNVNSIGNLPINIAQVGGSTQSATNPLFVQPADGTASMGTMANFGTSPGAVKSLNINASIMSGTTALGAPNTFGTTAPTGNALGVNASLFCGTTVCSTAASGIQKVGITGNAGIAIDGATGSAVPANTIYIGGNGSGNSTGLITCDNSAAVNMSTATTTQIIAISGTGGRTYICSINLVTNAANNVALVSGSGTNCASNLAGLAGGTTAATGWNFAANGGLTQGSGVGMIYKTVTTNNEICLVTSAATQLSGTITYTQF